MRNILIIDSDGAMGRKTAETIAMLSEFGTEVYSVENPARAWEMLFTEDSRPDYVIANIVSESHSESEEIELLKNIKSSFPWIKIILLSCFENSSRQGVWELKGVIDDLTPHPYNFSDLLNAIRE